ncbi:MAG: di-trans,poly-cis-decaprenylcistransferase [Myxococcales bacterium]|nr:di-trans,poly-cis-decaprenylcistransferase [Myxococcales bacterium]
MVQPHNLPRHVAIIMDGNGRWAKRRGLPRIEGHRKGADSVRDVVRASRELGLKALTLYAFSSQNWDRPMEEVRSLMELLRDYVVEERAEIMDNEIRLVTIGDRSRLPEFVRDPLEELIRDSAENSQMTLCLALSYGGRESIVAAARRLAEAAVAGEIIPSDIDAQSFAQELSTRMLPELDLVIRTSGEQRISNFLLWEAAYAELYFIDTLWPDFSRTTLYQAIEAFQGRERRFGLTSEQVRLRRL